MRRSAIAISLLVVSSLMAPVISSNGALAAGKKEEYKSPGATKKILLSEPLHGAKGQKVTVVRFTFPPGRVGGKHYHTGPVYVYVLKGSFVVREKGKKPQTLPAGTLYREPIGNPMQAHNASASQPTEILVLQIGNEGEPLLIKTDF